jgi:hypothetical protein
MIGSRWGFESSMSTARAPLGVLKPTNRSLGEGGVLVSGQSIGVSNSFDPRKVSRDRMGRLESVLQDIRDLEHHALLHPEREHAIGLRIRALHRELHDIQAAI